MQYGGGGGKKNNVPNHLIIEIVQSKYNTYSVNVAFTVTTKHLDC